MSNTTMIENYLSWKREKDMYPPTWTPEQWAEELLMSEARVRINLIADYLLGLDEPMDGLVKIQEFVFDPIELLMQPQEEEDDEDTSS
jgi:hypothetical protein